MFKRIAPFAAIMLAACTTPGEYPSLALRPIETRTDDVVAPAPAPVVADPALDQKIATLTGTLASNDAAFAAGAVKAEAAAKVPGAQAIGSDAWVGAQAAIAELGVLRGDTLGLMTDLEELSGDRGAAGLAPYPALDIALAKARTQLDAQEKRIAAIKAILGEK